MKNIDIYTDGACSGNPGAGGYGIVFLYDGKQKEFSKGYKLTTNNRMETMAVINALKMLKEPFNVNLYTDSSYVVNAIEKGWVYNWKKNGWINSSKKPTPNVDLWEELLPLLEIHNVKFIWVKGHADNKYNNRCDELATSAIRNSNLLEDTNYLNKDNNTINENISNNKVKNNNTNKGKKIVIYGDSISTKNYGCGGYEHILSEKLNTTNIYNYAICGTGVSSNQQDNFIHILSNEKNIHSDADLIIVWYGTNDWYWSNHLGNANDNDLYTFGGALNKCLEILQDKCKKANIILLTPIFRNQPPFEMENNKPTNYAYKTKNKLGYTLKDYKNLLFEIAENKYIPILDMHTLSQINNFNSSIYLEDEIHPSKLGYEKIGNIIVNFINNYYN